MQSAFLTVGGFLCVLQPAAIPVGLIKTCIHTYAALAVGVVVYNMDKAGARALSCRDCRAAADCPPGTGR
jgi:hypothetical protein